MRVLLEMWLNDLIIHPTTKVHFNYTKALAS